MSGALTKLNVFLDDEELFSTDLDADEIALVLEMIPASPPKKTSTRDWRRQASCCAP